MPVYTRKYTKEDSNDDMSLMLRMSPENVPADGVSYLLDDVQGCKDDSNIRQPACSLSYGLLLPI